MPALPEGWQFVRLASITSLITDGKHGDCQDDEYSGYYFLSAKDVRNGKLNYDDARQILKADFLEVHQRTNLEPDDVLITNSGTIGRVAIANDSDLTRRTTFQKSVAIIKPYRKCVSSKYLGYYLSGSINLVQLISKGTAQKNLLLRDLRDLTIAIPSQVEQHAIVEEIEARLSVVDNLEQTIETALQQAEALRQSILKQAFAGKLAPQDPDDEPAEVLLERIKSESKP